MMIKILTNYFHDVKARWHFMLDSSANKECRIFAGLELFCFPTSIFTLFVLLPLRIIANQTGFCSIAEPLSSILDVLLSAAIGYITNYLAIEMLFKPYRESKTHPLSIVTFGYWKQGLVPKNKSQIGKELGAQVEKKLLNPEQLANDLCKMVMDLLQDKNVIVKIKVTVQDLLKKHEYKIIDFLVPRVEMSICEAIHKYLTKDKLAEVWDNTVAPQLREEDNRKLVAKQITESLKHRSPDLVVALKEELRDITFEYMSQKIPFGVGAEAISNGFVAVIDWKDIEERICQKLDDSETSELIKKELLTLVNKVEEWASTDEGVAKVDDIVGKLKEKTIALIREYIQKNLPVLADTILDSESLWQWIENELLPNAKPQIETFIKNEGKNVIVNKLDISRRISDAVSKQDVEDFHMMINSVATQHLGAIQVLGFLLGALVGVAQIFVK